MRQRVRALRGNQSGFTLIELLIVIVILGVLAGIVVFAVSGITDRGKTAACNTEVSTVQTAEEAYYAKNNDYATTLQALKDAGFLNASTNFLETDVKITVNAPVAPATFKTVTVAAGTTGPCA
jgi:general secretion pathway protein G